jgi:hypothetical protein
MPARTRSIYRRCTNPSVRIQPSAMLTSQMLHSHSMVCLCTQRGAAFGRERQIRIRQCSRAGSRERDAVS